MRKVRVKKLREEFENSIRYLKDNDRLRTSPMYKRLWRKFKRGLEIK